MVLTPWFGGELWVHADEYSLEDVVTHVLRNAERYREAGTPITPITLSLLPDDGNAVLSIHNRGPAIPEDQLERIFEYGVSDTPTSNGERRGQGLFVARSYLAKMDGVIKAVNVNGGVRFEISLPRERV